MSSRQKVRPRTQTPSKHAAREREREFAKFWLKPPAHSGPRRSLAPRVCAIRRSTATGSITSPRRFCRGSTSNGDYHSVVIESYLGNTASKDFLRGGPQAPKCPCQGIETARTNAIKEAKDRQARGQPPFLLDPDVGQRHRGQTPRHNKRSPTCATGPTNQQEQLHLSFPVRLQR